jgi:hypothetical protein
MTEAKLGIAGGRRSRSSANVLNVGHGLLSMAIVTIGTESQWH